MGMDETIWDSEKYGSVNDQMECVCLECGISHYLHSDIIKIDLTEEEGRKIVTYPDCSECGGVLMIIGKAGDEPNYTTG